MTTLLLLLLPALAWAQGPDQVTTPQLTFDTERVASCTGRPLVGGDLAFCTSDGAQAVVVTSLTPGTQPPDPPPTVTTSSAPATTTTTTLAASVNHYYVRTDGSDTLCDGTADASAASTPTCAWATLTKAGAEASTTLDTDGVIVYVGPGTYTSSIITYKAGTATQPVRFISQVKWGAVIAPSGSGSTAMWTVRGPYQRIEDFQFTGRGWPGAIACNASNTYTGHHCQILGNYVTGIATGCPSFGAINTGVQAGGGRPADALYGFNVVRGNIVRSVGSTPACNQTHGIYIGGPYDVVENNIVSGVVGWGINLWGHVRYNVISNNTVFNNNAGGILIGTAYSTEGPAPWYTEVKYMSVLNNVVVNNGLTGIGVAGGVTLYDNTYSNNLFNANLLYGNYPGNWFKGMTDTYGHLACADPCDDANVQTGSDSATFVNFQSDWNAAPAANYVYTNYALKTASTAIDTGGTACVAGGYTPCVPTDDVVSTARPQDTAYDIGAFEFSSGATTTTTTTSTTTTTVALTYAPDWSAYLNTALTFENVSDLEDDTGSPGCSDGVGGTTWANYGVFTAETAIAKKGSRAAKSNNVLDVLQPYSSGVECTTVNFAAAFVCGGWLRPTVSAVDDYILTKLYSTDEGYQLRWIPGTDDARFMIGDGSGQCAATTDTANLDNDEYSHVAGVFTGAALKVYVDGASQQVDCTEPTATSLTDCTASDQASCPVTTIDTTADAVLKLGGDGATHNVQGTYDDWFCDLWDETPADDGKVDPESLCRILACGITGQGCQCTGATYTTGTGAGTDYALYGNSCTLPDCNQATP